MSEVTDFVSRPCTQIFFKSRKSVKKSKKHLEKPRLSKPYQINMQQAPHASWLSKNKEKRTNITNTQD